MSAPDSLAFQLPLTQGYRHLAALLVEDHCETSETLHCALEQMRIYAVVAHDGETALKIAGAMRFNLVILDVLLPCINGFETCRALRNLPEVRDVPVLFMGATSAAQSRSAALGTHYLCKPFGLPEFQARVEQILIAETQRQAREQDGPMGQY